MNRPARGRHVLDTGGVLRAAVCAELSGAGLARAPAGLEPRPPSVTGLPLACLLPQHSPHSLLSVLSAPGKQSSRESPSVCEAKARRQGVMPSFGKMMEKLKSILIVLEVVQFM